MARCEPGWENRQRFSVYVLELADGSLYVGSTTKSVSERVREHREGSRTHPGHRRHVVRYRADLSPRTVCATRERAEAIEERTARRLRAQGWEVAQR